MAVWFNDGVDITPSAPGTWEEQDLSSYISTDASIVVLRVVVTINAWRIFGCRSSDSAQTYRGRLAAWHQGTFYCKVGTDRKIDLYRDTGNVEVYLLGYWEAEAVGFDDSTDYLPAEGAPYRTVDVSGEVPADSVFAIYNFLNDNYQAWTHYERAIGSTDDYYYQSGVGYGGIVKLDTNRQFECKWTAAGTPNLLLVGYIKAGSGVAYTDGVTGYEPVTGDYEDVDVTADSPPSGADTVILELQANTGAVTPVHARPDGTIDDHYHNIGKSATQWATGIVSNIFEFKHDSALQAMNILGYTRPFTTHDKFLDPYQDITPATGSWIEVDISSYIPVSATVVILRFYNSGGSRRVMGARSADSSTDMKGDIGAQGQVAYYCTVGTDRKIDIYVEHADCEVYLVGWFTSEAVGFDDSLDYQPATTDWSTVDVSGVVPPGAVFAIMSVVTDEGEFNHRCGYRPIGSSTDNYIIYNSGVEGIIVPLDSNRHFEYRSNKAPADAALYLVGYITTGTGHTNWVAITPTLTGTFEDIDCNDDDTPPANADMVFIQTRVSSSNRNDLRADNSTEHLDYKVKIISGIWAVGLINDIFEAYRSVAGNQLYIWGYSTDGGAAPVADFFGTPLSGEAPLSVSFTDTSTNSPTSWLWERRIGAEAWEEFSTDQHPTGIEFDTGIWDVKLTATNASGSDTETKTEYIFTVTEGNLSEAIPHMTLLAGSPGMVATAPKFSLLAGDAGMIATVPKFAMGAGGYWTTFALMKITGFSLEATASQEYNYSIMTSPKFSLDAIAITPGDVSAVVPYFNLYAEAISGRTGSFIEKAPKFSLVSTGSLIQIADVEAIAPHFDLSATALVGMVGHMIAKVPHFDLTATGLVGRVGEADITAPSFSLDAAASFTMDLVGNAILVAPRFRLNAFGTIQQPETYDVFVMNTRNNALSEYINYAYNSYCKFGSLYLGAKSDGIYLLEGDDDEGVNIDALFATGLMNAGIDRIKRTTHAIFRMKSYGDYTIVVVSDDGVEYEYDFNDENELLHAVLRKVGKGIRGVYFKYKFKNVAGEDFEMDTMEFKMEAGSRAT